MLRIGLRKANVTIIYIGGCKSINIGLQTSVFPPLGSGLTKDTYKAKAISTYKLYQRPI